MCQTQGTSTCSKIHGAIQVFSCLFILFQKKKLPPIDLETPPPRAHRSSLHHARLFNEANGKKQTLLMGQRPSASALRRTTAETPKRPHRFPLPVFFFCKNYIHAPRLFLGILALTYYSIISVRTALSIVNPTT